MHENFANFSIFRQCFSLHFIRSRTPEPTPDPRPQTPDRIRYISFRLVYPVSELFLQGLRRMASLLWLFVAQFLEVASKRLLPHAQLLGSEKASNILTLMTSTAVNLVYGYALFPSVNENIHLIDQSYLASRIETISVITGQSRPRPKSVSKKLLTTQCVIPAGSGTAYTHVTTPVGPLSKVKTKKQKTKNKTSS